jgi:hypothetical protein
VRQHAVRDESADGVAQHLVVVGEEALSGAPARQLGLLIAERQAGGFSLALRSIRRD